MWQVRTLNVRLVRKCSTDSASTRDKLKVLKMAYASEGRYESNTELALDLAKNVVFYDNKRPGCTRLIVINKPAGVPLRSAKSDDFRVSLTDALPDLAEILKVKKVSIVKSVQRYASGCIILSANPEEVRRIERSLNRNFNEGFFHQTYYALTLGHPRKDSTPTDDVVDLDFEEIRDFDNPMSKDKKMKEPVIKRILSSKRKLKQYDDRIKRISVQAQVISKSEGNALLRLEPTSVSNDFCRVYCADLLSPILGDEFYSYRCRMLVGKMVRVNPQRSPHSKSNLTQELPPWMLAKLGLKEAKSLPLHLHLGRVFFPSFYGRGKDLVVHAPPRPFFQGTADMLGLSMPDLNDYKDVKRLTLIQQKKKADLNLTQDIVSST